MKANELAFSKWWHKQKNHRWQNAYISDRAQQFVSRSNRRFPARRMAAYRAERTDLGHRSGTIRADHIEY